jgi:hypothetical protein
LLKNARRHSPALQISEGELLMIRLVLMLCLVFAGCRQQLAVQQMIDPEYPLAARNRGEQGTVIIHITIGSDGKVTSATGSGAPDKVEISATPLDSDYPPLSDYKPNSQH